MTLAQAYEFFSWQYGERSLVKEKKNIDKIFCPSLMDEMVKYASKSSYSWQELRPKSAIDMMKPAQQAYNEAMAKANALMYAYGGKPSIEYGYLDGRQVMHKGKDRRLLLV